METKKKHLEKKTLTRNEIKIRQNLKKYKVIMYCIRVYNLCSRYALDNITNNL